MKRAGQTILAVLCCAALLAAGVPALAGDTADSGCGHVCGDGSCAYVAGAPCAHEHDIACGENGDACAHVHDTVCGFVAAVPCDHICDETCGGLPPAGPTAQDAAAPTAATVPAAEETTSVVISAFDALPLETETQSYTPDEVNGPADLVLPDTLAAKDDQSAAISVPGILWACTSHGEGFDAAAPGIYEFTAVLPGGYTLAADVRLPVITVALSDGTISTFAAQPRTAANENDLRNAINEFNADSSTDDMVITITANINLQAKLLIRSHSGNTLTIQGDPSHNYSITRNMPGDTYLNTQMFELEGNMRLVLQEITIDGDHQSTQTALITPRAGTTLLLGNDCILKNGTNTADASGSIGDGGAVYLYGSTLIMEEGSYIEGNTAPRGGGVMARGGATIIMNGGTIQSNTSTGQGGGVALDESSIIMNGGSLYGNNIQSADNDNGGGIYAGNNSTVTLNNTARINGNSAGDGGGIYATNNTTVNVNADALVLQNQAANDGGGVHLSSSSRLKISGGSIDNNTAVHDGGGVLLAGLTISRNTSHITMTGGSVSFNTATRSGGGLCVEGDGCTFTMDDGRIKGNSAGVDGGGIYAGTYTIFGNFSTSTMNGGTIQENTADMGGGVYATSDFVMNGGVIKDNVARRTDGASGVHQQSRGVFTLNGGLVFGNSATIPLVLPATWVPAAAGSGVAINWNGAAGATYTYGTTTDLTIWPDTGAALVFWAFGGSGTGVSYTNGMNTGFIPLSVTVNPMPITGSVQMFEVENVGVENRLNVGDTMGVKLVGVPQDAISGLSYRWLADGVAIAGATQPTYVIRREDVDKEITAQISASGIYAGTLASGPVTVGKIILKGSVKIVEQTNVGVAGRINVGDTLGVDATGILTPGAAQNLAWQWYVGGTPVAGATGATFDVPRNAVDADITVVAIATGDYTGAIASEPVTVGKIILKGAAEIVERVNVGVLGSVNVGDTLGVDLLGLLMTDAAQGLGYQWYVNGAAVANGTAETFVVAQDAVGASITVTVTATGDYTGAVDSAPVTVGKIILRGTVRIVEQVNAGVESRINVGDTLGVDVGGILTPGAAQNLAWQWHIDGVGVPGATGATFVVPNDAVGKAITVRATATGDYTGTIGSGSVTVGKILLRGSVGIAEQTNVGVAGRINVGDTLGVDLAGILTPGVAQYLACQWYVDGVAVPGATGATFVVPAGAVDKTITVTVTATGDYTGILSSAPVTVGKIILRGSVRIVEKVNAGTAGRIDTGDTLGVDLSGILPANAAQYLAYQWYMDGTAVPGETNATFVVPQGAEGKYITVVVTATGDYTGTLTGAAVRVGDTIPTEDDSSSSSDSPAGGATTGMASPQTGDEGNRSLYCLLALSSLLCAMAVYLRRSLAKPKG